MMTAAETDGKSSRERKGFAIMEVHDGFSSRCLTLGRMV
jgi:hypothetical protein